MRGNFIIIFCGRPYKLKILSKQMLNSIIRLFDVAIAGCAHSGGSSSVEQNRVGLLL